MELKACKTDLCISLSSEVSMTSCLEYFPVEIKNIETSSSGYKKIQEGCSFARYKAQARQEEIEYMEFISRLRQHRQMEIP